MRRFIQILALAIAGLLLTTDALGQAQITTRRENLSFRIKAVNSSCQHKIKRTKNSTSCSTYSENE